MSLAIYGNDDYNGTGSGGKSSLLNESSSGRSSIPVRIMKAFKREKRLLVAVLIAVVLMNIPFGNLILYPFMLFSTWIHEMCHGMAAIFCGGSIDELRIYRDGSGVAYTRLPDDQWYGFHRVIVASAGYVGTSIIGAFLLIFRRTRRGPRVGTIGLGFLMVLTCGLVVRNFFGLVVLLPMGIILMGAGWLLPGVAVGGLYAFLAVSCCLNAVISIHELFGSNNWTVNGEASTTDAHTVQKYMLWPYWFIATIWFLFAIVCCILGLVFGLDPSEKESDGIEWTGPFNKSETAPTPATNPSYTVSP